MTLEEAREKIGSKVSYRPWPGSRRDEGVITAVNTTFVFVRYAGNLFSKATRPGDLDLLPGATLTPRRGSTAP